MKIVSIGFLSPIVFLVIGTWAKAQELEPKQAYVGWFPKNSPLEPQAGIAAPTHCVGKGPCGGSCGSFSSGFRCCFPPNNCPDDYCPNPLPRQCWTEYPPFYRCVPAGDCAGCGNEKGKLSWWFIPKPQALRDALWLKGP
jgi:hypothetical protein